jgi:dihydroorotate dehydrogenase (NAD+) catalytic subunit
VIVHIMAEDARRVAHAVQRLEEVEGVFAIELGLPHDVALSFALDLVRAGIGELPLIARIPIIRAWDLLYPLSREGVSAISLGPPRGTLPGPHGGLVSGRLYGPAIYPMAMAISSQMGGTEINLIAAGGVYHPEQAAAMLAAGASAVQLDAVLWREGWTGVVESKAQR